MHTLKRKNTAMCCQLHRPLIHQGKEQKNKGCVISPKCEIESIKHKKCKLCGGFQKPQRKLEESEYALQRNKVSVLMG